MKKLVLLCCCILLTFSCFAEAINLDSMTDEELFRLKDLVVSEINRRGLLNDWIYPGNYIVGTDIKPGKYILTGISSKTANYKIIEVDTDEWLHVLSINYGEQWLIELEEGTELYIADHPIKIEAYSATPSWAP